MDINAQKTKISSSQKLGGCLQKASMLDSKFTLQIQEMGDALESMRATCQVLREDRDISNGW